MTIPAFCEGIQYFGDKWQDFDLYASGPVIQPPHTAIADPKDKKAIYQTLLVADALRYLTLQITASKASGHPGGFASSAEAVAAFFMLGYKNMPTEVGHHAPGYYSLMFLDGSLEKMGIYTVTDLRARFREKHGLLGHLSGYIPGLLAPAGPLGQGQHFAMAGAYLHPNILFPYTLGDGGMGEPYPMSSMQHFHTAFPSITNFLPILVWNGYSQEHHSMVSTKSNQDMITYWQGNGFEAVFLVDAKEFDDSGQEGDYVDSTKFSLARRMAFMEQVLVTADRAAQSALGGKLTVFIIKQLKGAGVHAKGAKSHNLYAHHTLDNPDIVHALKERALPPEAWALVRANLQQAGGGSAGQIAVTESIYPLPTLPQLPVEEYPLGENKVATTAMGRLVAVVGQADRKYLVTNADGNEASGIANINQALKIIHPTPDDLYNQAPQGQVYEPLSEDACAGLSAGIALFGGRSLWCSYESFAINGLPIWQTVTQAMAELRRPTPATVCLLTAGALEQGRNGWTHQRPEIEAYFSAMMRNGNIYVLFPPDANSIQICYEWALQQQNKGIVIIASKTALPVRTKFEQTRAGLASGAVLLQETTGKKKIVFAVAGDMILNPVYKAVELLVQADIGAKIISLINPRRLYRPTDTGWETCAEPDGEFLGDAEFHSLFGGDALLGITGGAPAILEPLLLRSKLPRDVIAWKRGETTASPAELMEFNGITPEAIAQRAQELINS
ncbi:MAG: phosphoketolase [Pseudanabaenaceae cyanobacterium]